MDIRIVNNETERKDAYEVRRLVFVHEQNVPEEIEIDQYEADSIHFVGYLENEPVAASRLRFVDEYGKLERICVLKTMRGKAIGKAMIKKMEEKITFEGYSKAKLNSQSHAEDFYKALGYQTVSDEFIDAGIPHITMVKELT